MNTTNRLVLFESANKNTWSKIADHITYPVKSKTK